MAAAVAAVVAAAAPPPLVPRLRHSQLMVRLGHHLRLQHQLALDHLVERTVLIASEGVFILRHAAAARGRSGGGRCVLSLRSRGAADGGSGFVGAARGTGYVRLHASFVAHIDCEPEWYIYHFFLVYTTF